MAIRRILVPVDFSQRSLPALDYAFALALAHDAAVEVLHVVPGPGMAHIAVDVYLGRPVPPTADDAIAEGHRRLLALVDSCPRHGIVPHLVVETGDAASVIVRAAAERPADLVVLGTRGHRGVSEMLLGSVAHKVIACCHCPVVTLNAHASA